MKSIALAICVTSMCLLSFMSAASFEIGDTFTGVFAGLSAAACLVGSCLVEISAQRKEHPHV